MVTSELPERFASRVIIQRFTKCWLWSGAVDKDGYGQYSVNDRSVKAHRYAYQQLIGPIGQGLVIDHGCRNRSCVNPAHMDAVTNAQNVLRGVSFAVSNKAKTHCQNGHEFTDANTLKVKGGRCCKACQRESARKHKSRPDVAAANRERLRVRYRMDEAYRERVKQRARERYINRNAE